MAEGARTERMSPWRTPADMLFTRRWLSLLSTLVVTVSFLGVQILTGAVSFLVLTIAAFFVLLLRIFFALRISTLVGIALTQDDMRRIESEHVVGAGLTTTASWSTNWRARGDLRRTPRGTGFRPRPARGTVGDLALPRTCRPTGPQR